MNALCVRLMTTNLMLLVAASIASAQTSFYVHPGPPPQAKDFQQPPDGKYKWRGPAIRSVNVKCWYAEPSAPNVPIGGTMEKQKVEGFVPIQVEPGSEIDFTFVQSELGSLSGGGASSQLEAGAVPAGVFLSLRAHPVFSVTRISYPATGFSPDSVGLFKTGLNFEADFLHHPQMGECLFFAAVWLAIK